MEGTTIFSNLLRSLGVPYTGAYSDERFRNMPFKSLFGFSRLLSEYGVDNEALSLSDKEEASSIPTPFIAQRADGFVIVNNISYDRDGNPSKVEYTFYNQPYTSDFDDFRDSLTGIVLRAYPSASSIEPDYGKHCLSRRWVKAKAFCSSYWCYFWQCQVSSVQVSDTTCHLYSCLPRILPDSV